MNQILVYDIEGCRNQKRSGAKSIKTWSQGLMDGKIIE